MALIFITITVLLVTSMRKRNETALTIFPRENSQSINGFFVITVFLSHFGSYMTLTSKIDVAAQSFIAIVIGQTMVMTFFVFSGYGIYSSMVNSPDTRNVDMLTRMKKLLANIVLAMSIYIVYNLIVGNHYSIYEILFSFTGWTSIGNSNWYIFTILILYILMFLCFNLMKNDRHSIVLLFVSTAIYAFLISSIKPDYWVNTIVAFPLGVLIKFNEARILKFLAPKYKSIMVFLIILVSYIILKLNFKSTWVVYNFETALLLGLCTIVSIHFKIRSRQLMLISRYVFEIYIYQRLVFDFYFKVSQNTGTLAVLFLLGITILIAVIEKNLYNKILNRIDLLGDRT